MYEMFLTMYWNTRPVCGTMAHRMIPQSEKKIKNDDNDLQT